MTKTTLISAFLVLVLLFIVMSPSTAEIKNIDISSDTRLLILFEKFRFTRPGRVAIAAWSVSVVAQSSQPNLSRLGFFLLSKESPHHVIEKNPTSCILDLPYTKHLFTFLDLGPPPMNFNRSYPVTVSGEYTLFFANCVLESSVTMEIQTELFSLNADGSRNYLSSSQTKLPYLFFLFSFSYLAFFLIFSFYPRHVSKQHSFHYHRIHLIMPQLLLTTALSRLFAALDMNYVKLTGTHGWDTYVFSFDLARVVLLFSAVVLVGTRWTFLHPLVKERGKNILFLVIPLQVVARALYTYVDDTGPYIEYWVTWSRVFLFIDLISCCAIVFLIVWSMRSSLTRIISNNTQGSLEDHAATSLCNKLSLIKRFYMVVIGYLFFTRFVMFALETAVITYEYQWVSNLVEETATFVFCNVMFYVFRVLEKDEEYSLNIGEEEEKTTAIAC